jgi:CubicO group peptidase (beta-lactamase class C family)
MQLKLSPLYFILLAITTYAQQQPMVAQSSLENRIDSVISIISNRDQFTGSMIVLSNDKLIWKGSFGEADLQTHALNSSTSNFEIASLTKPFTALAIGILRQQGLVAYDDPVSKYLPGFPYKEVTIRHLLTHTSGIQEYYQLLNSKWDQKKIASNLDLYTLHVDNSATLSSRPGEAYEYSNTGYIFLALLIERVSGLSYQDFLHEKVFKVAGMNNSIVHTKLDKRVVNKLSRGYEHAHMLDPSYTLPDSIPGYHLIQYCAGGFYGDGMIYSNVEDLAKFTKALFSFNLLKKELLAECLSPGLLNNGEMINASFIKGVQGTYGLGWAIADSPSGKMIFHTGGDLGYRSILLHNIDKNQTVIMLDNRASRGVFTTAWAVMQLLNGNKPVLPTQSLAIVIGRIIINEGLEKALSAYDVLKNNKDNFMISEAEFNELGGTLLHFKKIKEAVAIAKVNTEQFPLSWNAWDSYAETLLNDNQKELAIKYYKKSLELNPENVNAKKVLLEISK